MNLKRVNIEGLEIFKIDKKVNQDINIQTPEPEESKTKEVRKKIKTGDGNIFLLSEEGQALQAATFTHKKKIYAGHAPNLIHIYFDQALAQIQWSNKYADSFKYISKQEIAEIGFLPDGIFNRFIQLRVSAIIFLHLSVEAFINHIIPDDFVYTKVNSGNTDKFSEQITNFSKKQIERWSTFNEKIENVIPQVESLNFDPNKNSKIIGRILEIGKIRDEIVHLKSKDKETMSFYKKIFNFIGSRDLMDYMNAAKKYMNILEKDFIKIKNVAENEPSQIVRIEEKKYLNIGVLFEIVRIREKRITVYIKKWKGLTSDNEQIKAILSQLPIMDEMKIIYDYIISEDKKDIKIEIFKTDEQIK
ncbi:hypothetical protein [Cellulophaga baltica]|uniref:hypothetical protein n=1 Tax=Cellulophaga baltica TaxID=76594 RepID=UPI00042732A8|nr:hypothetical protein [Cellulophaga baltica]AIY13876.1 hypothetical protein M667_12005 [Cellulophaga baltica NN016038]